MTTSLKVLNNPTLDMLYPVTSSEAAYYADKFAGKTWAELDHNTGGLSKPSKMPCHSYSLDARRCQVGSALRNVPGSTCSKCYAMKGRYVFPNVRNAMERRYDAMVRSGTLWTAGMIASIRKTGDAYFRWHDSGDVQGYNHLHNIMVVANHTPNVKHWLPTREYALIREWVRNGKDIPENLVIRVSVPMIGGMDGAKEWDNFSTVDVPSLPENVKMDVSRVDCPAYTQGGKCGSCRSCWDRSVNMINYPLH